MTGNDIVDIATAAAETNWRRKDFLQKIFTEKEQLYIKSASIPDQTVWRLWTMKESAYKIYIRQYGGRFFAPQKLSCTLLSETTGQVIINTILYQTLTSSTNEYIYSIAVPQGNKEDFLNHCFDIPAFYPNHQELIYNKMIARYAGIKFQNKNNFTILKEKNNIPYLYCRKEKMKIPVSITHHGNFAAFTIN
jgi:phosphopantetheinyl transferase (holo-ACP synthase)